MCMCQNTTSRFGNCARFRQTENSYTTVNYRYHTSRSESEVTLKPSCIVHTALTSSMMQGSNKNTTTTISVCLYILLVMLLSLNNNCVSGQVFYITTDNTNPTTHCPGGSSTTQCMSLSQFARANSQGTNARSNTTLMLLPGQHTLDVDLSFENMVQVTISAMDSDTTSNVTTITCGAEQPATKFHFQNVTNVHISDIQLFGCVGNNFTKVDQLTIENCEFSGQGQNGTGLYLEHVSDTLILNSSFYSLTGQYLPSTLRDRRYQGGAIVANNSNVVVQNCAFDGNTAKDGGAMFTLRSNITIASGTSFSNNRAENNGGAIYTRSSNLIFHNCTATNNSADQNGGVLIAIQGVDLTIESCDFTHNTALYGGSIRVQRSIATISNCTFSNNLLLNGVHTLTVFGGAICSVSSTTFIFDSTFTDHNVSDFGGAVYTKYGPITIQNARMYNNQARRGGGMFVASSSLAILENVFASSNEARYDGGGLWSQDSMLNIENCQFENNTAIVGSAIRSISGSITSVVNFTDVMFMYNDANFSTILLSQNIVTFSGNLTFTENKGSLFVFSSNASFNGHAMFTENSHIYRGSSIEEGGALTSFQSVITFRGVTIIRDNMGEYGGGMIATESEINNHGELIIENNTAIQSGGGIYSYQSGLNFRVKESRAVVKDNNANQNGGGIYASSSIIRVFGGTLKFLRNSAGVKGGGVSLDLSGKLYVIKERPECDDHFCNQNQSEWINLEFSDNSARYGGAIHVSDTSNSGTCASTPFRVKSTASQECFFQGLALYSFTDRPTMNFKNTEFHNNTAIMEGDTIYGGLLDRCSISAFAEVFPNYYSTASITADSFVYIKNVTNIRDENIYREISSNPVRVCFCEGQTPEVHNCAHTLPTMYVKKGQMFHISAVVVNQINSSLEGRIQSTLLSGDGGVSEGQYSQKTQGVCTKLNYTLFSPNPTEQLALYADGPCKDIGISQQTVDVVFLPCDYCPIGFQVPTSSCVCGCHPNLFPEYVTSCDIQSETVRRKANVWISYINETDQEGYITFLNCPYDYCNQEASDINLNVENGPDTQCAYNRSKLLCGACQDGLSLTLGSSRCKLCSNYWLALLIIFAIAGIALVAFLLVCNLTVAVGTINGLIFYANIIESNSVLFLPFQKPNFFTVFIAWLNLDFGFETCFYNGLDGYGKTWWQIAFPIYIILLVILVIILSEYSSKFAKLLHGRDPIATLATLILLSHSKLLLTMLSATSFAKINFPNETVVVWLYDANIRYFEPKHIPLFIIAVLIFVLALVYTSFLLSWPWLKKFSNRRGLKWMNNVKLYSLINPYFAPYSYQHRYWTGVLLLTRAVLYLITAINVFGDPSINLLSIIILACFLLLLKERYSKKVYTNSLIDLLESSYIFNLIIFSAVTLYFRDSTVRNQQKLAYISTAIAFATFLLILCYHTYVYALSNYGKEKFQTRFYKWKRTMTKKRSTCDDRTRSLLEDGQPQTRKHKSYSQLRGPLELVDDESITVSNETPLNINNSDVSSNGTGPTYSEVEAIPTVDELLKRQKGTY